MLKKLSDVVVAALAGAIKDTAAKKAKANLEDGFEQPVDFCVRVRGVLAKGHATKDQEMEVEDAVPTFDEGVVLRTFASAGFGPKRLKEHLEIAWGGHDEVNDPAVESRVAALREVFEEEARRVTESRDKKSITSIGKAGSVSINPVTVELIESPTDVELRLAKAA